MGTSRRRLGPPRYSRQDCRLHGNIEHVGIRGLRVSEVFELFDEKKSGDREEFLGGATNLRIKVFAEFLRGHELEDCLSKKEMP